MELLIDTDALVRGIEAAGASGIAFFGYLMKKGYIQVWIKKIYLALRTSLEEINALNAQNGKALDKLNMSDELVEYLQKLAPSEDGTIDEEKAIAVLHDCIKWNNHIIKTIPRIDEVKK